MGTLLAWHEQALLPHSPSPGEENSHGHDCFAGGLYHVQLFYVMLTVRWGQW